MDQAADLVTVPRALPQPLLQGVGGQIGAQGGRAAPADDATGVDVHDERDVDPARPGRHVRQVGDPQPVRCRRSELPLHEVVGAGVDLPSGDRGPLDLAAHGSEQTELAHQPLDLAARDDVAFALQLPPDLADAVDTEVVLEDLADDRLELLVPHRPRRRRTGLGGVVGARSELRSALVDVGDQRGMAGRARPRRKPTRS
jgi:hypothetical protein